MNMLKQGVAGLATFIEEVKVELAKCSWPTRKELFGQSFVVIISVVILGAVIGLFDLVNFWALDKIMR